MSDAVANNTYAAIDLGSNSFHMVVAEPVADSIRIVDSLRLPVRLGSGLDEQKRLKPETREIALDAISQFAQRLRGVPRQNVRVVGTNTLRRAKDADAFINEAFELLNKRIEVIAGREEARVIFQAVAHGLPSPDCKRLIIDIGGGSTELVTGTDFTPEIIESMNMGCVSYTTRYLSADSIDIKSMKRATTAAKLELQPVVKAYRTAGFEEVVGCSGTIKSISRVLEELQLTNGLITRPALRKLMKLLVKAGSLKALNLHSISSSRAQVFTGGLAVLSAIMSSLKIDEIQASQVALREGLIFQLIGKKEHSDIQNQTVDILVNRYHADPLQRERVTSLARRLFSIAQQSWQLDPVADGQLMQWAADLHEIGLAVAHSQYHKHGAYVLENSDLLGFSRAEQFALSFLVRYHRRKIDLESISHLPPAEQARLIQLLALTRLTVLLMRSRYDENLTTLDFQIKGNTMQLSAPSRWFSQRPLTTADLEQESSLLAGTGISLEVNRL